MSASDRGANARALVFERPEPDIVQARTSLRSLRDLLRFAVSRFEAAGVRCGQGTSHLRDEAAWLLLWSLRLPLDELDDWLDCRLTGTEIDAALDLIGRRCEERIPAAWLTGEAWLRGVRFLADPRALVPRSPIAELLELFDFPPLEASRRPIQDWALPAGRHDPHALGDRDDSGDPGDPDDLGDPADPGGSGDVFDSPPEDRIAGTIRDAIGDDDDDQASIDLLHATTKMAAEADAQITTDWVRGLFPADPRAVLDLCTGGASLAILAALQLPDAAVVASDIDPDALALAKDNLVLHGLSERIRLVQGDLFGALQTETFDLILCNPPYVCDASMHALPAEFRAEPRHALAGGSDGMHVIRQLIAQAAGHLNPGGVLLVEVGHEADHFEAAFPELEFAWLPVSAGERVVALITRAALSPA